MASEILDVARAFLARYLALTAPRRERDRTTAFGASSAEVALAVGREAEPVDVADEQREVERASAALDAYLARTPEPRLARLAYAFGLSPLDVAIACVLLAPELDHDLERAYTFALDDVTRKRPDVGFIARVLGAPVAVRIDQVLQRLEDAAPLRRNGVVAVTGGDALVLRAIRLADRVVAFLRGHDTLDELLHGFVRVAAAVPAVDEIVMDPDLVARIARALVPDTGPPRVLLAGPDGSGKALVVEALFAEARYGAMRLDLAALAADPRGIERLHAALREAALRDVALIVEAPAAVDASRGLAHAIGRAAAELAVPIVFALRDHPAWLIEQVPVLIELDVPPPAFRERLELWRRALPPSLASAEDVELVAGRYAFTAAGIVQTARRAAQLARLRDPETPAVTLADLGDSARLAFSHELGGLAQRIPTGFTWGDLVLPRDTEAAIDEVVRFAHHRAFLLEDWGFAAKLPYGRGVSAILAGPPGTGKTMVAQLIAKELGYDLYRIDLSQIVDKYIGETEKNLAKLFDRAEAGHAVLFFDEADSLFARRTDVKSSNDRYANLEVNYLLQRMETFDGVTLLATNLSQGIDDAFRRRVRFSIQFELPDEHERRRLWRSMFPPKVPLAADIDWDAMARGFAMSGGYIKKAALRAALIAASARRAITTADLLEAARLEYREMGRIA